jgi:hypothetical protein
MRPGDSLRILAGCLAIRSRKLSDPEPCEISNDLDLLGEPGESKLIPRCKDTKSPRPYPAGSWELTAAAVQAKCPPWTSLKPFKAKLEPTPPRAGLLPMLVLLRKSGLAQIKEPLPIDEPRPVRGRHSRATGNGCGRLPARDVTPCVESISAGE